MKKIFILFSFLTINTLHSQVADIHDIFIVAGIGDPYSAASIRDGDHTKLPFFIKAEYNIKRKASLGLGFGHYSNIYNGLNYSSNRLHLRFVKYLYTTERFTLYIATGLGYNLNLINNGFGKSIIDHTHPQISINFQIGTRFLVTKHFGIYIDYFYDISMIQPGLFYKIYRK